MFSLVGLVGVCMSVLGLVWLTPATRGVGFIAFGCACLILARLIQAAVQQHERHT